MARPEPAHSDNAPGPWFVDTRCIRCDSARNWAPGLIEIDERRLPARHNRDNPLGNMESSTLV